MNGSTSVSLRGSLADFQSNTVSFTQVAFAHPVLSILKIVSPKQLSLARCHNSNTYFSVPLTRAVAFAAHPVLSVEHPLYRPGSSRPPSAAILKIAPPKQLSLVRCCHPSSFRSPDLSAAAASTRGFRTGAPLPAGPRSARDSTVPAQDLWLDWP
jgi:hypothetical protein